MLVRAAVGRRLTDRQKSKKRPPVAAFRCCCRVAAAAVLGLKTPFFFFLNNKFSWTSSYTEPPKVSVKTAVRYLAIFVKCIPGTVANNEIQTVFNTKALVGRFKSGHCKVLVPESELGRALSRNSVSGHKIRVKK